MSKFAPSLTRLFGFAFAVAVLAGMATTAHAEKDVVQFGNRIHVAKDSSVHDAVCFFCSVDAEGTVNGDIVVFFGNVHVGERASHDVVNFFGSINVDDGASISQDVVNFFGGVRLGENASIGKDLVVLFGGLHADDSATIGGDRVVQPGWIFWVPLLLFVSLIVFVVRSVREQRYRRMVRGF